MAHRGLIAVLWAAAVVAAIMVIGRPAAAQIDQEVTVRVRGTTGEEIVRLHTDTDQVLLEQQVPTGWVDLNAVVPAGTVDLYVAFVNDGRTSTGADRNLLVDHVRWGADLVEAESVEGRGVWDGTRCDALAFHSSEFLACNGFFRFPVPDAVPGGIAYAIEVVARGSTGSEIMQLELNGNVVAEWQVSTDWMPYSPRYTGPEITSARVLFVNDGLDTNGRDRNLAVELLQINDLTIDPVDVPSKGVWNGVDCNEGLRRSKLLACNGWFDFTAALKPPPPPSGPTVQVRARGTTGTERVQLLVDGEPVWSATVAADWATYLPELPTDQYQSLRVAFVNDGRDGTGADRNLLIDWIVVGGQQIEAETLLGRGVWDGTRCDIEAVHGSQMLACNGWFEYRPEPPPPPTGDNVVRVRLRGSTGTEEASLSVNGLDVQSLPVSSDWAEVTVDVGLVETIERATVRFLNDGRDGQGRDRNLMVDWIEVGGQRHEAETLWGRGVWDGTRCDIEAVHGSELLACNGWFEYRRDPGGAMTEVASWLVDGDAGFYEGGVYAGPRLSASGDAVLHWGLVAGQRGLARRLLADGQTVQVAIEGTDPRPLAVADGGDSGLYGISVTDDGHWVVDAGLPAPPGLGGRHQMSDDGSVVVAHQRNAPARIWHRDTGAVTELPGVFDPVLAGDGHHLFYLTGGEESGTFVVRRDLRTGDEVVQPGPPGGIARVADDGSVAAFIESGDGGVYGAVIVVDMATGEQTRRPLPPDRNEFGYLQNLHLSADGSTIIYVGTVIDLIDVATGDQTRYHAPENTRVTHVTDNADRAVMVTPVTDTRHRVTVVALN